MEQSQRNAEMLESRHVAKLLSEKRTVELDFKEIMASRDKYTTLHLNCQTDLHTMQNSREEIGPKLEIIIKEEKNKNLLAHNENLQTKVNDLQKNEIEESRRLTAELAMFKSQLEVKQTENDNLLAENENLLAENENLLAENENLLAENRNLLEDYANLEREVHDRQGCENNEIRRLTAEMYRLKSQLEEKQTENKNLLAENTNLHSKVHELQENESEQSRRLSTEMATLKSQLEETHTENDNLIAEHENLFVEFENVLAENEILQTRAYDLQECNNKAISRLIAEVAIFKSQLGEKQTENTHLLAENKNLYAKVHGIQESKTKKIRILTTEMATFKSQFEEKQTENKNLLAEHENLLEYNGKLLAKIHNLQERENKKIRRLIIEMNTLKSQLEQEQTENKNLLVVNENVLEINRNLHAQVHDFQKYENNKIGILTTEMATFKSQLEEKQTENDNLLAENRNLLDDYKNLELEVYDFQECEDKETRSLTAEVINLEEKNTVAYKPATEEPAPVVQTGGLLRSRSKGLVKVAAVAGIVSVGAALLTTYSNSDTRFLSDYIYNSIEPFIKSSAKSGDSHFK
uniref:flagellar attachment zone protein 1-like n=1 Tax=Monopterus albus TaxID=43700 RepID=UPI0009B40E7D|nr:flagellar attachment zone protein 1-like [Monopterus albus]